MRKANKLSSLVLRFFSDKHSVCWKLVTFFFSDLVICEFWTSTAPSYPARQRFLKRWSFCEKIRLGLQESVFVWKRNFYPSSQVVVISIIFAMDTKKRKPLENAKSLNKLHAQVNWARNAFCGMNCIAPVQSESSNSCKPLRTWNKIP